MYRNRLRVLRYSDDGGTLWVRTPPLHWALDNVPCECTFDTWITLAGSRLRNTETEPRPWERWPRNVAPTANSGPLRR